MPNTNEYIDLPSADVVADRIHKTSIGSILGKAGAQIGLNAVNSAVGGLIGLAGSALQHKYNKQLAEYQYDRNLEMWNKQNEYNTPIAQRKRLEEAGLNPALMYGNGSVSTGNASSIPEYQQMGVDLASNMLSAMQLAQMSANIRLTNAEATGQEKKNNYIDAESKAIIDLYLSETKNKDADTTYKYKLTDKLTVDINAVQKSIDKMTEEILFTKEQVKSEQKRRELMDLQKGLMVLQQVLTQAQTRTENARTGLVEAQKGAQEAEKTYKEAMTNRSNEMLGFDKGVAQQTMNKLNAEWLYKSWEQLYVREHGVSPNANMQQAIVNLLGGISQDISNGINSVVDMIK